MQYTARQNIQLRTQIGKAYEANVHISELFLALETSTDGVDPESIEERQKLQVAAGAWSKKKGASPADHHHVVVVPADRSFMVRRGGALERVSIEKIVFGDILIVRADMVLPVDCVVSSGVAHMQNAYLTGETAIVKTKRGGALLKGTICERTSCTRHGEVEAVVVYPDGLTTLDEIAESAVACDDANGPDDSSPFRHHLARKSFIFAEAGFRGLQRSCQRMTKLVMPVEALWTSRPLLSAFWSIDEPAGITGLDGSLQAQGSGIIKSDQVRVALLGSACQARAVDLKPQCQANSTVLGGDFWDRELLQHMIGGRAVSDDDRKRNAAAEEEKLRRSVGLGADQSDFEHVHVYGAGETIQVTEMTAAGKTWYAVRCFGAAAAHKLGGTVSTSNMPETAQAFLQQDFVTHHSQQLFFYYRSTEPVRREEEEKEEEEDEEDEFDFKTLPELELCAIVGWTAPVDCSVPQAVAALVRERGLTLTLLAGDHLQPGVAEECARKIGLLSSNPDDDDGDGDGSNSSSSSSSVVCVPVNGLSEAYTNIFLEGARQQKGGSSVCFIASDGHLVPRTRPDAQMCAAKLAPLSFAPIQASAPLSGVVRFLSVDHPLVAVLKVQKEAEEFSSGCCCVVQ